MLPKNWPLNKLIFHSFLLAWSSNILFPFSRKFVSHFFSNFSDVPLLKILFFASNPFALKWNYLLYKLLYISDKDMWNWDMKSFSNETLNLFFKKLWASYILDLAKTVWALRILSQKFSRNFGMKELWALENHVFANILLCSSYVLEEY